MLFPLFWYSRAVAFARSNILNKYFFFFKYCILPSIKIKIDLAIFRLNGKTPTIDGLKKNIAKFEINCQYIFYLE